MLVTDGVLVFGLLQVAKVFAERTLDTVNGPNLPDDITGGGTVRVHDISFIAPALNGIWEQIPLYPDTDSTTACGALFRHQDDFRDAADAIMKMERAEGFVICNDPTPVLSQGVRFIGRYDWNYGCASDGDDDDDRGTYNGEYCLVGSRDSVRGSANRHEAQRKGAMFAEFDGQEYMFGRQWFTEDGKLRALLVYTYNMPEFFADCRLGTQLLAPPLNFSQPDDGGVCDDNDDELRNAVIFHHPIAVMQPALEAGAFSRVLALFANRSMPVEFFMAGLWATDLQLSKYATLRYDERMWNLIDHENESVLNELRAAVVKAGWVTRERIRRSPVLTAAFEQGGIALSTEQSPWELDEATEQL